MYTQLHLLAMLHSNTYRLVLQARCVLKAAGDSVMSQGLTAMSKTLRTDDE